MCVLYMYFYIFIVFCFVRVGAKTMRLNKGKLRKFAQSGEVVAAPVSLKRKKVDLGPSKQAEQSFSRPPICDAIPLVKAAPLVIMVDVDSSLPADPFEVKDATINQSPHVAMSRAKSVVSSKDMDDYSTAHTEDVHYLLIHSLMRVSVFIGLCYSWFSLCFALLLGVCRV
jgi:hypothetical protein